MDMYERRSVSKVPIFFFFINKDRDLALYELRIFVCLRLNPQKLNQNIDLTGVKIKNRFYAPCPTTVAIIDLFQ